MKVKKVAAISTNCRRQFESLESGKKQKQGVVMFKGKAQEKTNFNPIHEHFQNDKKSSLINNLTPFSLHFLPVLSKLFI